MSFFDVVAPHYTHYAVFLIFLIADKAGAVGLEQGAEVFHAGHQAAALIGVAHQDLLVRILYHLRCGNNIHALGDGLLN